MKKILSLVLVLALALSFTLTSFAETYIHKTYMDTETGIIYHYGSFDDGDTDAGVMINGKKYSLKNGIYMGDGANAFAKSSTREDSLKNKFMIGFKAHDTVAETYQVTPYSESENGIVTSNPITVFKDAYEAPLLTKTVNAITDDIAMVSNGVSATVNYTTIKTDGLYGGMEKNPAQLYITMMKIDLSQFSDAAEGSNFILNVSGYVGEPSGACNIDKIKVKAYGIPSEAFAESETYWSESDYSSLGGHAKWYESYIYGKPASDVLRLSLADSENIYHKLNITGYIQSELAKKSSYATIALVADNKEASENAVDDDPETTDVDEKVRNAMRFFCYTKESSTPPYVEYQYGDKTVELNEIKIGESFINLDMLDSENTYYKYLPAGTTEFPQVTATANDLAVVQVTQATEDTKEAVITLTHSYYTDVVKTYKVKFVETDRTYSLKQKVLNNYYATQNSQTNGATTSVGEFRPRDIYGWVRPGYEPAMDFIRYDFSAFADADPNATYILELTAMNLNVDYDNIETGVKAEVALYDMTNNMDWSVDEETGAYTGDAKDGTKSKAVDENIKDKTPFASFLSDDWKGTGNGGDSIYLDISDFIADCIENENLTPTIGLVVKVKVTDPDSYEFKSGFSYSRTNISVTSDNADFPKIHCIDYVYPDLSVELESLNIGEESIGLQWIDSENTYYKYLPYGTEELPVVTATNNDASTIEIVQATMDSKEAVITLTNINDTSIVKTYKVKFIISDKESVSATYSFRNKLLHNYAAAQRKTDNSVRTPDLRYIYTHDSVGTLSSSYPYMGIIQADFSSLADADLSGAFTMSLSRVAFNVSDTDATADFNNFKAYFTMYDMSDNMDWSHEVVETENDDGTKTSTIVYTGDAKDATKSKDIEGNIAESLLIGTLEFNSSFAYTDTPTLTVDISEFVRKCIRENNLTPSIGFNLEIPDTTEFVYSQNNTYARGTVIIYCDTTDASIINYYK